METIRPDEKNKDDQDMPEKDMPESDTRNIRNAGTESMENPPDEWDEVDQEGDESFPASDPPANY